MKFLVFFGLLTALQNTHSHSNQIDGQVFSHFFKTYRALSTTGLAKDKSGLIGRNHSWGRLYSPRFQLGSGKALRFTLHQRDFTKIELAYLALDTGLKNITPNGLLPSHLPSSISKGKKLKPGDVASAASFYLGDACMGMLALQHSQQGTKVISQKKRNNTISKLVRASGWLLDQEKILLQYDKNAPNRLLFDALAFYACGKLGKQNKLKEKSKLFVQKALALQSPKGFFREGGGWDTSYQAVAIVVGKDLLLAGYASEDLGQALYKASNWLANRVLATGRVNSAGNRRTCEGGESFFGKQKRLSLIDVFSAMAYMGIMHKKQDFISKAQQIVMWYENNPGQDPCFTVDPQQ